MGFSVKDPIRGSITGNAATATKATQDSDGNTINTTYLKKSGGAITGAITRDLGSGTIADTNLFTVTGSTDGFKINYNSTTADVGITTLSTTDDANAKISIGNTVSSTYKEAISITNGEATIIGLVSKATGDKNGNDITTTYYKASNPNGYTSNTGTITKVQANGTDVASSGTANIPAASTSVYGVTKLSNATDSTSEVLAATPKAVKAAYDLAAGKGTGTITGVSVNGTSVATSGVANITSVPASILSGAIPSAVTATTQSASDNSTKLATTAFVKTAIDNLPEPMVFKGSLGTGGTITALPTDGSATVGDTYKVITAGTYASKAAKVGDTFICLTKTSSANTWELIPSGDEPSGTVTSITLKATSPIAIDSTSAITTSGTRTLSHANSGVTADTYRSVTVNATGHVTAGTNPTTLSGYGITDAKIASGVITLGSNTITPLTADSTLNAAKVSGTVASATTASKANLTTTQYGIAHYTDTSGTFGNNPCLITTSTGGLEVKGIIAGDSGTSGHGLYSGGGYHNAYNNVLLHGDETTGSSGIAFISDKITPSTGASTQINQPSDRAFIQYHAYGITTAAAEGSAPTIATSGEKGRLVIGIGNDADDQVWLQTPGRTGLIHQVGASSYAIPDTNNTSGSVGSATQPIYSDGAILKSCTYSLNKTVPSDAVFTDTKNTAGSTDTSSKIFLIGATNQAANPQTYSDNEVFATSGVLQAKSYSVNGGATIEYNSTNKCIEFNFV